MKIIAITGARSEYDLMSGLYKKLNNDPEIDFGLVVTGAHLSDTFGFTAENIHNDNIPIYDEIFTLIDSGRKIGRLLTAGNQVVAFANSFTRINPDLILVAGDREEVISSTMSAAFLSIPIAHFFGGDIVKDGNIDNAIRYAGAKFAHLHFVTVDEHKSTLLKLGEPEDRIFTVGSPALDKFIETPELSIDELSSRLNFDLSSKPFVILIQHPIITELDEQKANIQCTLDALSELDVNVLINYPNSDPGNHEIISAYNEYVKEKRNVKLFHNLDRDTYVNLMRHASCLVGNSSSGLHEAPSVGLPAVNVGSRQRGRIHGDNIIFVDYDKNQILEAMKKSLYDEQYIKSVKEAKNPYGNGDSVNRIYSIIKNLKMTKEELTYKDITYDY